jgi:molecular chaperone GrpE
VAEDNNKATEQTGMQNAEEPAASEATNEGLPLSLEDELAASRAEAEKNWDLYLRQRAELENFRKRSQREKEDLGRFANENLLRDLLPVLDNLERALDHARKEGETGKGLLEGVEMTLGQFQKLLEKFGVSAVDAMGEPFNPAWHEAMGQLESTAHAPNTVIQEMQKGYVLNERLLRPALVLIAKAPPVNQPNAE